MYREDGQIIDLGKVREAIRGADVLIVGFPGFAPRLLLDSRHTAAVGPMVQVVQPLGGIEERMFWLGQNRPAFPMPERFTFFVWPHSLSLLEESGTATALRDAAGADGAGALQSALDELCALEHAARKAVVTSGEPWRTLWHAQGSSRSR